jgi:putative glutamine amidotransferase
MKPKIGVTGPVKGGTPAWWFTAFAVWLQGGWPVRIHPGKKPENTVLDGLILGGGADINPKRYGELIEENAAAQPKPKGVRAWFIRGISVVLYPILFLIRNIFSAKSSRTDTARDELEFALLEEACSRGIPVLGICRGAQLINVKFGGTLHQDISGFYSEVPKVQTVWPRKSVEIAEKSKLYAAMHARTAPVNALHNQAVDTLGEHIVVSAREKSGIIQGIEHRDFSYLLGVQWHPEYMPQVLVQRKIFRELVKEAKNRITKMKLKQTDVA